MADHLRVDVVSADRQVWSGQAEQVIVRTTEGEIGLLANHTPLLATIAPGDVRIHALDGDLTATVDGGFLSMEHNRVSIVAGDVVVAETSTLDAA